MIPMADCQCPDIPLPPFDEEAAKGLEADEVRRRWPRGNAVCVHCGAKHIVYASGARFIMGDW